MLWAARTKEKQEGRQDCKMSQYTPNIGLEPQQRTKDIEVQQSIFNPQTLPPSYYVTSVIFPRNVYLV
jgi:hypothetical protein